MKRCDFKYCPDCGARLDRLCPSDATPCSAFVALMACIDRIRDRAQKYAEEFEEEHEDEDAEMQRKVEGTLSEILRIGKVLESNLSQNA